VQVGRYRAINAVPSKAQQDLLQVMVQVTLPGEVKTIQAAVQYLLLRSGYQLEPKPMGSEVQQLLSKPIPAVHRHLGPMALHSALETLAGFPFQLQVDPVHRQVSYGLPQSFSHQERP
jgi:type IV pili sensor histidine kinase/response regulator